MLLIEDHPALRKLIISSLSDHFIVDCAVDLDGAYYFLDTQTYDLLLSDVHLPDGSGLSMVDYLRENKLPLPILFMTADQDHLLKLHCLKNGSDFLLKPFTAEELLLRCQRLLSHQDAVSETKLSSLNMALDYQLRRVSHHGVWLALNCKEFLILEALLSHPNQPISREILLSKVWADNDKALFSNSLETYIAALRRKLGRKLIKTIRGKGYALIR